MQKEQAAKVKKELAKGKINKHNCEKLEIWFQKCNL